MIAKITENSHFTDTSTKSNMIVNIPGNSHFIHITSTTSNMIAKIPENSNFSDTSTKTNMIGKIPENSHFTHITSTKQGSFVLSKFKVHFGQGNPFRR